MQQPTRYPIIVDHVPQNTLSDKIECIVSDLLFCTDDRLDPLPGHGRTENKPSHSKAPTYRQGSRGDTRLRTPACRLSTRTLVPELKPCVEVSLIISGWYLSTSHTDPGSFPTRELMFHIHTASLGCQGSVRQGLCPRLPQHTTHPTPTVLPVGGGPTGGHRDLFFFFLF